jgi:hypothetical protein
MNGDEDIFWAFLGTGFGAWTFFKGFRVLRNKRLVENTPTSKCRSVAMGFVEVSGKARGDLTFPSLIGQVPCYCSEIKIERYEKRGKSSSWHEVHKRSKSVDFYVEDETGRVRVNPVEAEFDLSCDVEYESESGLVTWLKQALSNEEVQTRPIKDLFYSYCIAQGVGWRGPMRFKEYNLCPGGPVFVMGTAGEVPGVQDENLRVLIRKGQHHPWFFIAEGSQKDVLQKLGRNTWLYILGGMALTLISLGWLLGRLGML